MRTKIDIDIKEAEYESVVRRFSSSGYIPAPKMFIGRKVRVIVLPETKE